MNDLDAAHELAVRRRMLDWADVDLIQDTVRRLPANKTVKVVDLGAGSGTTSLAVLCTRSKRIEVLSVDIAQDMLDWAEEVVKDSGYRKSWQPLLEDSVRAAELVEEEAVDFLMIDTVHEYEQASEELRAWLPKVSKGRYVWVHDYLGIYPGIAKAVAEKVLDGLLEQMEIRGLGWLGRKL